MKSLRERSLIRSSVARERACSTDAKHILPALSRYFAKIERVAIETEVCSGDSLDVFSNACVLWSITEALGKEKKGGAWHVDGYSASKQGIT